MSLQLLAFAMGQQLRGPTAATSSAAGAAGAASSPCSAERSQCGEVGVSKSSRWELCLGE